MVRHDRQHSDPGDSAVHAALDGSAPSMAEAERRRVLYEWNATQQAYPQHTCIHQLVEAQAARTPDYVALIWGTDRVTYRELNARANQLAHYLRKRGVGPESLVAICAERSPAMIVGLLGILKAGGAYVPLDPAYPSERLAYMLEDSRAAVLLTATTDDRRPTTDDRRDIVYQLPAVVGGRWSVVDLHTDWPAIAQEPIENPRSGVRPENLAYVIYTSGSTGRPKGVAITHRSAVAFIAWALTVFSQEELRGVLAGTSICFDLSVFEIFATLTGGTIILGENVLDLPGLTAGQAVTLINSVPSAVTELLRLGAIPASARTINLAGEPLPLRLAQQLYQLPTIRRVINLYGPSEDTTYSTYAVIARESAHAPPIGRPIANTQVYLLDQQMRPVPVGAAGELYLGGEGLARGYLNRPELTAEKFVPNPFATTDDRHPEGSRTTDDGGNLSSIVDCPSSRLYRTGDLARYRPDGQIEFLGRIDHQVKIRGFRIELGEIEAAIDQHPAVSECVVVAREDAPGDKRLVAYVVSRDWRSEIRDSGVGNLQSPISNLQQELRASLKRRLPDYMIPAAFVTLEALPRTPNGKINRQALPAPAQSRLALGDAYVPPRTPVEAELAAIWEELLGVGPIGIHDHFIDLGGHSLHATRILARVNERFQTAMTIRNLFERPTIAGLAEGVGIEREPTGPPIAPAQRDGPLPASFAQQGLWFLDQWEPGNPTYNIPIAIRTSGSLDVATLQRSLDALVQRHEILRTSFASVDGQPVQVIADKCAIEVPIVDLSDYPAEEREAAALQIARQEARHRFDLAHGPLIRAVLLRLGAEDHLLVLIIHHIISDDWSTGVFFQELGALYAALRAGEPAPLPQLPIQYADFAVWHRQWLQGENDGTSLLERQLAYWRGQLAGAPASLELPTDRSRPLTQSFNGATHTFVLPAQLVEALVALSREQGATLFMALLAAFQTLLYRHTGQEDILVGTPIAGRPRAEVEPLIGCFVNTLVLRSDLAGNPTFHELLGRVRETCLEAYANQDLPFEHLVEDLRPARDLNRTPLIQVMLVLQNAPAQPLRLEGLTLAPVALDNGTAKLDLTLYLEELDQGLRGTIEYSTDLFDTTTIARLAGHFQMLLEAAVANPGRRIAWLDMLTTAEQGQLVRDWNRSEADYPREACAHQLFEAQAARTPDVIAVTYEQQELTYAELNARANQLAHHLRQLGVGPDTLVGLCVERSLEMIVGMLGILKAGGAYVPLDPAYPPERIQYMLEDSGALVVLTTTTDDGRPTTDDGQGIVHQLRAVVGGRWSVVDLIADWPSIARQPSDNLPRVVLGQHRAYVIYTSGSTGRPKGVMVCQRGLLNLCYGLRAFFDDPAIQHTGLITSISFDISVNQIFPTLLFGRTLHIVPDDIKLDSAAVVRFVQEHRVQLLDAVPSYMQAVLKDWAPKRLATELRYLLIGGEKLEHALLTAIFSQIGEAVTVVNIYGLTEITDINAFAVIRPPDLMRTVTVGQPLQNNRIYLTSKQGALQPVGVIGEVCVSGESVSRGYLNRPELTAEKFVPCLFEDGAIMCRTGDLGRRQPDGTIVILGRMDHQVKVRGYRIELGEIEAELLRHADVREAVVVARPDAAGESRLVAYLVPSQEQRTENNGQGDKETRRQGDSEQQTTDNAQKAPQFSILNRPEGTRFSIPELRAFLQERLPGYMVPSAFVMLDILPRTPNGKLDRKALPEPQDMSDARDRGYAAPRTPVETILAGMWGDALEIGQVSIHDNFFDLGGHSLNATRIVSRIRQAFQIDLTVRRLFATPTVASLAGHMVATEAQPGRTDKIARALQRIRQLSTEDRQKILQQKKGSENT